MRRRVDVGQCFVCGQAIHDNEPIKEIDGEMVHLECANLLQRPKSELYEPNEN